VIEQGSPTPCTNDAGKVDTADRYRDSDRLPFRMHFDAHQPVIADYEARMLTLRDSL